MFDSIGCIDDAEAGRRGAAAAGLSLVLVAIATGLVLWSVAHRVVADPMPSAGDGMVLVDLADPGLEGLPPPPPPPPAHPATRATPEEMDERVASLTARAPQVEPETAAPAGAEGGVANGVAGGTAGGVVGGTPGAGGDGVLDVDFSRVEVKRRARFVYPKEALPMHLGVVACRVRVSIDERGIPYAVGIQECPVVFHDAIQTGLRGWRWYPARKDGHRVRAQFLMQIRFVP